MRTETAGSEADTSASSPVAADDPTSGVAAPARPATAAEPEPVGPERRRRRTVVVALWPYHSVRGWILRRRKVIDLRDRGLNAAVGLPETATRPGDAETPSSPADGPLRPGEPSGPAGSGAGRGSGTTG